MSTIEYKCLFVEDGFEQIQRSLAAKCGGVGGGGESKASIPFAQSIQ